MSKGGEFLHDPALWEVAYSELNIEREDEVGDITSRGAAQTINLRGLFTFPIICTILTKANADLAAARARAIDPTILDRDSLGKAQEADYLRAKFENALLLLRLKLTELQEAENADDWHLRLRQIQAQRDVLAEEFSEVYPKAVQTVVGLLRSMAVCDGDIHRLHLEAPINCRQRLVTTECAARNIEVFDCLFGRESAKIKTFAEAKFHDCAPCPSAQGGREWRDGSGQRCENHGSGGPELDFWAEATGPGRAHCDQSRPSLPDSRRVANGGTAGASIAF